MSQWGVQLVIGRLIADELFRKRFAARADETLEHLREQGIELTDLEVAAFIETDPQVWTLIAKRLDRRLRPAPATRSARRPPRAYPSLTPRERHVLRGIFEGLTNKQIADTIGVSESAVKATLQHLFRKTHVRTRAQLVRIVIEGSSDEGNHDPPACRLCAE